MSPPKLAGLGVLLGATLLTPTGNATPKGADGDVVPAGAGPSLEGALVVPFRFRLYDETSLVYTAGLKLAFMVPVWRSLHVGVEPSARVSDGLRVIGSAEWTFERWGSVYPYVGVGGGITDADDPTRSLLITRKVDTSLGPVGLVRMGALCRCAKADCLVIHVDLAGFSNRFQVHSVSGNRNVTPQIDETSTQRATRMEVVLNLGLRSDEFFQ